MTSVRISTPEEIAARAGTDTPFIRLPERATLFAERELRLRQLAAGHAMRDFLLFMAELAHEQHAQLQALGALQGPDAAELERAAAAGMPPLPATDWPRDPAWRGVLRGIVRALQARPGPAADTLGRLASADDAWLEQQADRLLHGVTLGLDLGAAPIIAAALQVCWTQLVLETQRLHVADKAVPFGRTDDTGCCPCCGSRPTASIVRVDTGTAGQRYLHCALCGTQWHRVRIECTHCGSNAKVHYQTLQPVAGAGAAATVSNAGAVQAECCDDCGHYLKIVHMEKDAHVEAVADDLASITLDLLVAESGMQRHGVNLMLLFGDPDTGPPDGGPG